MNELAQHVDTFVEELEKLFPLAKQKVLVGFEDLEAQADAVGDEAFRRAMATPSSGDDFDAGSLAEDATGAAQEAYESLFALRQGATNLLAVWLFHVFELHRRDYRARARVSGDIAVSIDAQPTWNQVAILERIANTVKHGEDRTGELRRLRPDLFHDPVLGRLGYTVEVDQVRLPLGGDGPFVTTGLLDECKEHVAQLWREVQAAHEELNRSRR